MATRQVVLVQTVIPDYRTPLFEELLTAIPELTLISGTEDWQPDVLHAGRVPSAEARNRFLAGRGLLWQHGVAGQAVRADVAVITLNPRIVSGWVVLLLRRIGRRPTIVWGHAWPRKGRASRTDRARALMRRLATSVVVYTETEASAVRAATPGVEVVAASNALYRRRDLLDPVPGSPTDIVCVGRLTASKRPDLLVEAFALAASSLPTETRLVLVGDGPARTTLERRIDELGLRGRVVLTGHVSGLDELRTLYGRALAAVSPGEAGLSVVQSLGFGVPIVLPRDANHGPEAEAAREGETAVWFAPSTPEALAAAIARVVDDHAVWEARRPALVQLVRTRYSIDGMVEAFRQAIDAALPTTTRP